MARPDHIILCERQRSACGHRELFAHEIASKLEVHTAIEEEIFYPAFREAAGTKKGEEQVLEAYEEHHVVKLVLGEIPQLDCGAETFEAKMTVLKELIEHHVEEEEKEMFPSAEKKLGKTRLEELGVELEERASELEAQAGDEDEERPEQHA